MTNLLQDALVRVAALKAMGDAIREARSTANQDAMLHLGAGDRLHAKLPSGADIGTVSIANGRTTTSVSDAEALLTWVKVNHPTEVVESVRPAFVDVLKKRVANIDGHALDTQTGEVVPGLTFNQGDPYVAVKQTEEQLQAFTRGWVDGELREQLGALLGAEPKALEEA